MKQVQYVSGAIVALAILMGQGQVFGADANYVGHGEFTDHGSLIRRCGAAILAGPRPSEFESER